MAFRFKDLLLVLYLGVTAGTVVERAASLGPSPALLFYVILAGSLYICLILAAQVRSQAVRIGYAIILAASAFLLEATELIMGDHLSYDAFINLIHSAAFADEAFAQHRGVMLRALAGPALLFLAIALKPRPRTTLVHRSAVAAPLLAVFFLAAILFMRGGDGSRGLPVSFTPLAYSSLYLYEAATGAAGARKPVSLSRDGRAVRRDIVLIVDESVLGSYLDLNSSVGLRSGLKERRAGAKLFDFGKAASITNCSVGTNVTLRFGGTRSDYQRINATMPSIWAYAREAGLATVYIDAQRTGGQLHNLMTPMERAEIVDFVQFDTVAVRERDMAAADAIAERLNNDRAEFILVNKVGAHFPVHDKYPDAFMRYRPALDRGHHVGVSDTGRRDGFSGGEGDWLRYRNSYRNTLLWNVGAFFDRLFIRADMSRATLLYTSDHGQDLHETGRKGVNTHCSSAPVPEEGIVPLVVIEGAGLVTLDWGRNHPANRDRTSHYQIFPTLLELMGYNPLEVRSLYGDSLVVPSRDPGTFNILFNARLGREPAWLSIRRAPPPAIAAE